MEREKRPVQSKGRPFVKKLLCELENSEKAYLHKEGIIISGRKFYLNFSAEVTPDLRKEEGFVVPVIKFQEHLRILFNQCSEDLKDHRMTSMDIDQLLLDPNWDGPYDTNPIVTFDDNPWYTERLQRKSLDELKQALVIVKNNVRRYKTTNELHYWNDVLGDVRDNIIKKLQSLKKEELYYELDDFGAPKGIGVSYTDDIITSVIYDILDQREGVPVQKKPKEITKVKKNKANDDSSLSLEDIKKHLSDMTNGKTEDEVRSIMNSEKFKKLFSRISGELWTSNDIT